MGFFSDDKPKVTRDEFQKVCSSLYNRDWNEREVKMLRSFFEASIKETRDEDRGLDVNEVMQGVKTLRDNEEVYHLSEKKLSTLEELLKKYL